MSNNDQTEMNLTRLLNNWVAWYEMEAYHCGGLGCLLEETLEALEAGDQDNFDRKEWNDQMIQDQGLEE